MKYSPYRFLLLIPLLTGGCVVEAPRDSGLSAAAPEQPSRRLTATFAGSRSQAYERLDPERLQAERDRIDALARTALNAANTEAPWQPVLQRILFQPDNRQLAEYREQFRGLPIIATPIRLEIRNGQVTRIEGTPHRPAENLGTEPVIDRLSAEELARIYVSTLPNALAESRLVIFHDTDESPPFLLAWQIDLPGIRVWIDAREGRMLKHQGR